MRRLAIIGSGPAGFYTAEAALKAFGPDVEIDIIDRLPTPYGLIRAGVAPDHQSIKAVSRRYDKVANDASVRFLGNLMIGVDVGIDELTGLYDDVVLAVGAPLDRRLGIPGDELPGVIGSAAFVGWYNGHPDHHAATPVLDCDTAVVIGNGNVALDCARIISGGIGKLAESDITNDALAKLSATSIRDIHILGRRGPHQVHFTIKEISELGELDLATPQVNAADFPPPEADDSLDSGQRRVVGVMRRFAGDGPDRSKPITIHLGFFQRPLRVIGSERVEALEVMKTSVDGDGRVHDTGETAIIPCGLLITAIGYRTASVPGVPFSHEHGRFQNTDGLIAPGLWCVGWSMHGPSGTIGTNRPEAFALVERIAQTPAAGGRQGRAGLLQLLGERQVRVASFADWQRIDQLEVARARAGAPREKIVHIDDLRAVFSS